MPDSETWRKMARGAGDNFLSILTAIVGIGMFYLSRAGYPNAAQFVLAIWAMMIAGAADTYTNVLIANKDHPHD